MALAGLIVAIVACVGTLASFLINYRQIRHETEERKRLAEIVERRRPEIRILTPIVDEISDSYRIRIPIVNEGWDAHDVHITVVFPKDAQILEVDPGEFKIRDGGVGKSSVVLEASFLPRKYSPLYPTIIATHKYENIRASCAEETGYISLPPTL